MAPGSGVLVTQETRVRVNCIRPGPAATPLMDHFERQMGKEFMENHLDPSAFLPKPKAG